MTGFFDRMLGRNSDDNKGSGATAKDRLKMVLTHDRIKMSPEKMREMKAEIIAVIAKYVPEIDPDSVDIALDQSDRFQNRLIAEIPFSQERVRSDFEDDNDGNDDLTFVDDYDAQIDGEMPLEPLNELNPDDETIPSSPVEDD